MLIEYKFKFEKNGFTITQQIGSGTSGSYPTGGSVVEERSLKASFQETKASTAASGPKAGGNGFGGHYGGNGGPHVSSGTAPATFIGPFIMCCPHDDSQKENKG